MKTIKLYRMVQMYGGGWRLHSREVREDRTSRHLQVGWRATEREARYLAVKRLNDTFMAESTHVWNSKVEPEE